MKKLLSFTLAMILLAGMMVFPIDSANEIKAAWPLGEGSRYWLDKDLSAQPVTFEAVVNFPTSYLTVSEDKDGNIQGGVGGNIFGNLDGRVDSGAFGISRGYPVVYWRDTAAKSNTSDDDVNFTLKFDKVVKPSDVYKGVPVHIAIVCDFANKKADCYIDGVYKETVSMLGRTNKEAETNPDAAPTHEATKFSWNRDRYVLGGDARINNNLWFRGGELHKVAVYSDKRTANEIEGDVINFGKADGNLIVYFDLTDIENKEPEAVEAKVGGYTAVRDARYLKSVQRGNYAYSLAVIGDTQSMALNAPQNFHYMMDWLLENKEDEKIEYVIGLGDITDKSTVDEWNLTVGEYERLYDSYGDGYFPIRGNHDLTSTNSGQTVTYTPLDGIQVTKPVKSYDAAFKNTNFASSISTSTAVNGKSGRMVASSLLNAFKTENIGGVPFLILALDYGAADNVLAWADKVVSAHPNHNVIVATHGYLNYDGEPLSSTDLVTGGMSNTGLDMWNEFISKHKNISLVMSGHIGEDYVITSYRKGNNGNSVTQILTDHQSVDNTITATDSLVDHEELHGLGVITMLYFSGDIKDNKTTASIETLSTVRAMNGKSPYYWTKNQYSIDIELNGTRYDITGDDKTTIADVLLVIDDVAKGTGKTVDITGDGKITLLDVLRVAKLSVAK